jgi:hypothetical protein
MIAGVPALCRSPSVLGFSRARLKGRTPRRNRICGLNSNIEMRKKNMRAVTVSSDDFR